MSENNLNIEVIYAQSRRQFVTKVTLDEGSTFGDAVRKSNVLEFFPELVYENLKIGSYGKIRKLDDTLTRFDRVEIYRPVVADIRNVSRRR